MPRKVSIGVCVLAALALAAATAPVAQADRTWAGEWTTTWQGSPGGEVMTLDETGTGTFENGRGTISGGVIGDENRGTWQTPNANGTFVFTLTRDGLGFSGQGAQSEIPFAWHGYCSGGPCLDNAKSPEPVKFHFRTDDGLPSRPGEKDLPDSLQGMKAKGSGTLQPTSGESEIFGPISGYEGQGTIELTTRHKLGGERVA